MNAIIARPAAGATKAPARAKAAPRRSLNPAPTDPGGTPTMAPESHRARPTPAHGEGDSLAFQAAEILQTLVMAVVYDDDNGPRDFKNAHLSEVDHLLGRLLAPEFHEPNPSDPLEGDVSAHLAAISSELENALDVLEKTAQRDDRVALFLRLVGTTRVAAEFSDRLILAHQGLPGSLDQLRALTTYAGARSFREQPRPPIRRSPEVFDLDDLGDRAIRLNLLVEWCVSANATLERIRSDAAIYPAFAAALRERDIRFSSPDWGASRMDEAISDVMTEQFILIHQMAGGPA